MNIVMINSAIKQLKQLIELNLLIESKQGDV